LHNINPQVGRYEQECLSTIVREADQEETAMKVRDIMTSAFVSCQKETDIGTAARLMLEGRFGTLPVVDTQGTLVGIITDRDIAMAAATRQRNASHIAVHETMSQHVRTCFADDELSAVLKQMEEGRVRRLVVLSATGQLAGIVSIDDVVRRALDRPGGVPSAQFVNTVTAICSQPAVEPDTDFSDTFVSG
jgi:CBS domain-containing protein